MTSSPHHDVVEGFGTLTSVSTSLQYCDGRVRGLAETCVDGRLSLPNHALGTKAQFKQVRFCDFCSINLAMPLFRDSLAYQKYRFVPMPLDMSTPSLFVCMTMTTSYLFSSFILEKNNVVSSICFKHSMH